MSIFKKSQSEYRSSVSPEDIMRLPNSREIIKRARDWVYDNTWNEEPEVIEAYDDARILRGVNRHYSGGLEQFLKDGGYNGNI